VRCLWYYLSGLLTKPTIYDTDLEEAVDNALGDMGRNAKMGRPCIRIEHMTAVREVARDMVKEQYTMEGWRELEEEEKVEWVRKLGEVLGWRLRAGRG
jgi:ribosomal protein L20A (L18A)